MRKFIFSNVLLFLFLTLVSAQKEIYFSNIKAEEIKQQSLDGIEVKVSINPFMFKQNSERYDMSTTLPVYIGYFHEKHISGNWTLNSSAGFYNNFSRSRDFIIETDSVYGNQLVYGDTYSQRYSLEFGIGIEPRWNWNYLSRAQKGNAKLNSGGFLSFPLIMYAPILQTPNPMYNIGLFTSGFYPSFAFLPTIGYRQVITNQLFLEGSFSVGLNSSINTYNTNHISFTTPTHNSAFNIKAAYTF